MRTDFPNCTFFPPSILQVNLGAFAKETQENATDKETHQGILSAVCTAAS